jgi:hypothetical protein
MPILVFITDFWLKRIRMHRIAQKGRTYMQLGYGIIIQPRQSQAVYGPYDRVSKKGSKIALHVMRI